MSGTAMSKTSAPRSGAFAAGSLQPSSSAVASVKPHKRLMIKSIPQRDAALNAWADACVSGGAGGEEADERFGLGDQRRALDELVDGVEVLAARAEAVDRRDAGGGDGVRVRAAADERRLR